MHYACMYAHCRETHACMAESLSALVMNTMEAGFSPNTFAENAHEIHGDYFAFLTVAQLLAQVVVLLYTI